MKLHKVQTISEEVYFVYRYLSIFELRTCFSKSLRWFHENLYPYSTTISPFYKCKYSAIKNTKTFKTYAWQINNVRSISYSCCTFADWDNTIKLSLFTLVSVDIFPTFGSLCPKGFFRCLLILATLSEFRINLWGYIVLIPLAMSRDLTSWSFFNTVPFITRSVYTQYVSLSKNLAPGLQWFICRKEVGNRQQSFLKKKKWSRSCFYLLRLVWPKVAHMEETMAMELIKTSSKYKTLKNLRSVRI